MILQALADYYRRKAADPDPNERLAPQGFEWKEIFFILEIDRDGKLVQIEDTREVQGKREVGRRFLVPLAVKKSVNVEANLLWGRAEYVLGLPDPKKLAGKAGERGEATYKKRVAEAARAFVARIEALPESTRADTGVQAVRRFLEHRDLGRAKGSEALHEITEANPNLAFRLNGDPDLVCQREAVVAAIASGGTGDGERGVCLVTGEHGLIERLHPAIKGVWGAQPSGANVVSFNLPPFDSYAKEQGANAPVGRNAAFAYTTALNHLLGRDSPQRLQVGDASTVFWAERPLPLETQIVDIFGEPPKDDPDRGTKAVRSLYRAIETGALAAEAGAARFFVLGLAPNAARIAVRFWHVGTVADLAHRIRQHFDDLEIVRPDWAPAYPSLLRLMSTTAVQGAADNIQPNLAGDTMRSILTGVPFPATLLQSALRRCRAERQVPPVRAALVKACINRETRYGNPAIKEELKVSLDPENPNVGYRLGRLFAVLEKAQEEANPGINATIRDRFYGSASSTPVSVFPNLMRLKNHHLAKLENRGRAVNLERLIGEIMAGIADFPAHLALLDQGRFAVGYYHQRQVITAGRTPPGRTTDHGSREPL
jgi:CRISPR-associated protein Csd1